MLLHSVGIERRHFAGVDDGSTAERRVGSRMRERGWTMSRIAARMTGFPLRATVCAAVLALAPPAFSQDNNTASGLLRGLMNNLTGQPAAPTPQTAEAAREAQRQAAEAAKLRGNPGSAGGGPISADLAPLFAKGTVNGAELIGTLSALQQQMRQRKANRAAIALQASVDSVSNNISNGKFDISNALKDTALNAAITLFKQVAASAAAKALDDHMTSMLEDPNALAAETITLPPGNGMNADQARRTATMAALVVGARVTSKLLDKTKKEMEGLKTDYSKVIQKREDAAKLLYAAITERNKALNASEADGEKSVALRESLSPDDLAFLDKDLGKLKLNDFSKDMAAQNLALSYLQKVRPEAFASYRTEVDDVVRRTKSYMRTMTGIAAFGAMTANFVQSAAEVAREKQLGSLLQTMPMMIDFVTAAAPLASVAVETAVKGVELGASDSEGKTSIFDILKRKKSFIFVDGDKPQDMASAKDVFKELNKHESASLFKGALFRSDAPGMLQRIGECDRAEAGRMLDVAVPKAEREEFAMAYFNSDVDKAADFSFVNAFESPGASAQEQLLPAQLLSNDLRDRATSELAPLSKVQLRVSEKYDEWGDGQLMRLIFANREGQARHATLYVGELKIRPVASPEAVFAYETAADSCRKLVTRVAPPPPPPKAAAAAPTEPPPKKDNKAGGKGKTTTKKDGK